MKTLGALVVTVCLAGCSYGPAAPRPTECSVAHAKRQSVPLLLAQGSIASALTAIDEANAACPDTRKETRGDEVKLLAELGRCDDARKLADAIDADRDTSDGAWLAGAVARARCEADATSKPGAAALAALGRLDFEAGRLPSARRRFDRALAFAAKEGLEIRADCTRWSHKPRFLGAYQRGTNALILADGDHALVLSADDGRERLYLSGHGSAILYVAASADGRWILTASADDVVLWSTEDGARLFQGPGTGPLAFSDDGRRFAFVPGDKALALGIVGVRDVERRELPATATGIALLPDSVAVSLSDDTFRVLGADGREKSRTSSPAVRIIAPIGGDKYLLAGKLTDLRLASSYSVGADVVGGGPTRPVVEGRDEVFAADPLGKTVLTSTYVEDSPSSGHTQDVLRDVATGKDEPVTWVGGAVVAGNRVFSFDDRDALHAFDAGAQKDRVILPSLGAELREIGLSPDAGSMLVTFTGPASLSAPWHWQQLWQGGGVLPLPKSDPERLYFAGDDRFLLGKVESEVQVFSARTGAMWARFENARSVDSKGVASVSLSQSGRFAVIHGTGGHFRIDLVGELPPAELPRPLARFDGDQLVVVRADGDEAWLDPSSLRELRHAKPRNDADAGFVVRECRNLREPKDCVDEQYGDELPRFTYVAADGAKVPFEPYPHTPATHGLSTTYLAAAYKEGSIVFYGVHGGAALLYLRPFADGTGGYATTPDGRIELFGDAEKRAVCRMGALSLPFFACEERFGRTGLLASVMKTGLLPPFQ